MCVINGFSSMLVFCVLTQFVPHGHLDQKIFDFQILNQSQACIPNPCLQAIRAFRISLKKECRRKDLNN